MPKKVRRSKKKDVKAPVKDKTPLPTKISKEEDIEKKIAKLEDDKRSIHIQKEEVKYTSLACGACETTLNVPPEEHMKPGIISKDYVCPNCERVNIIQSNYDGPVDVVEGEVKQRVMDFVWLERPVSNLTDDQVIALVKSRAEEVEKQDSILPPREQEIFRLLGIIIKRM